MREGGAGMFGQVEAKMEAGAESIVRELVGRERDLPCFVRHEDAGGKCERSAVVKVYGLNFCELHGAEVKAGALQELYEDASDFLHRLDNPQVVQPNPAALAVIRDAVGRFLDVELDTEGDEEAAIRQAYPVIPERVEKDTVDFDYEDPARGFGPQTIAEQKRKNPPPGMDAKIRKYQRFREEHDGAWQEATQHPVKLYEFFGLNADEVKEIFGEPPEPEAPEKDGKLLDSFLERLEAKMGDAG